MPSYREQLRDYVNSETNGALDSPNYRVYINEYGYPMVESVGGTSLKVSQSIATIFGYVIGLSLLGIAALGAASLFVWLLFQVSSFLFGGS